MTRREMLVIRQFWRNYKLRFRANGTVEAKPDDGLPHPWGLLYTKTQLDKHIASIRSAP